jgi:hypothetical protein
MFQLVRALVWLAIGLAIFFVGRELLQGAIDFVQAGPQAELDAARGNNKAFAAGVERQNASIDASKKAQVERKAKSEAAVKAAGEPEFKAAAAIQAQPAPGATPLERAANRINNVDFER